MLNSEHETELNVENVPSKIPQKSIHNNQEGQINYIKDRNI